MEKRPNDPQAQWKLPHLRAQKARREGYQEAHVKLSKPQLTINDVTALRKTLFDLSKFHYQNERSPAFLQSLSPTSLKNYLQHGPKCGSQVKLEEYSYDLAELLDGYKNYLEDHLPRRLGINSINYAAIATLTKGLNKQELQSIHFLMNTAHLFHTLKPGDACGVIHLARNKLSQKGLPTEIRLEIIEYLLLDEEHSDILDQRYHHNGGSASEDIKKEITSMQQLMVTSIVNVLAAR